MTTSFDSRDQWHASVPKSIRRPAVAGLVLLFLGVAGFGIWACTAPISSAIIASGRFIATGQNKIIQHLEGGILEKFLVEEGDTVTKGQVLVQLDRTSAEAQLRRLELSRYRNLALQGRLEAESASRPELAFPSELEVAEGTPEIRRIIERQKVEFATRREEQRSENAVLEQRISAIREEIEGLRAQRQATTSQLDFITEELSGQETLFEKGLSQITKLLALKRAKAKLEGEHGKLVADMGRAKVRITETEAQTIHLKTKLKQQAVEELRNVEKELDDLAERIKAARNVLARIEIRSPVNGVVVKISHHTVGGVVSPGQEILELLPIEDDLLIEALVRPLDVDAVRKGDKAQLRLTALNQRVTPTLLGEVIYVSADTIEGAKAGEVYYMARIRIDRQDSDKLAHLKVSPGMPVEVHITTGERTFFAYMMKPISDSFSRAFREG